MIYAQYNLFNVLPSRIPPPFNSLPVSETRLFMSLLVKTCYNLLFLYAFSLTRLCGAVLLRPRRSCTTSSSSPLSCLHDADPLWRRGTRRRTRLHDFGTAITGRVELVAAVTARVIYDDFPHCHTPVCSRTPSAQAGARFRSRLDAISFRMQLCQILCGVRSGAVPQSDTFHRLFN